MDGTISFDKFFWMFFLLTIAVSGFFIRTRYSEFMGRMDKQGLDIDQLQMITSSLATKDSVTEAIHSMNLLAESIRMSTRNEIDNLRNNEIKELHSILRDENRELRREVNEGFKSIRGEISGTAEATVKTITAMMKP